MPYLVVSHIGGAAAGSKVMAQELGWDADRVQSEVEHYIERVAAERASQEQVTDAAADELRVRSRHTAS